MFNNPQRRRPKAFSFSISFSICTISKSPLSRLDLDNNTSLKNKPAGNLELVLKVIALTRIVTKYAHLPVTTALSSIGGKIQALEAGANVIMFNFTPQPYQELYEIYPDENGVRQHVLKNLENLEEIAARTNRWVDYSIGDSLKHKQEPCVFEQ